jgi:dihydrolipoamide dehydrogenase
MARVRSERDRFVGFVLDAVEDWPSRHKIRGRARFIAANELLVDDRIRVLAERIVIATGSSPLVPEPWSVLGDRLLINDDVFAWDRLPESIAVVGTGVIGLELGQALSRLGVKTHLIGAGNRFGPVTDPVINACIGKVMADELTLVPDARVEQVARTAGGVAVSYREKDQLVTVEAACLLAATGRRPNLGGLDLQAAGITVNDKGIPDFNDTTGQIGSTPVFIAGDASNAHPLLHEAADDGRMAGDNAGRFPDLRVHPRRAPLSIIFTDPQIMLTGKTFASLSGSDCQFAVGEASFEDQGRSRVLGRNKGVLRVYGEQGSGLFLGAEMFGPAAEHLGHLLAWSVQQRLTVQQMLDSPYYHPVIEEGLRTALRGLSRRLHMGPEPVKGCLDCGPGA